jgi:molybdopterin/thiamine biosynthesis adenylyltransferase
MDSATGTNRTSRTQAIAHRYYSRLDGILSPAFHEKKILVVGLGAGSFATEILARLGPRSLVLCDHDRVEYENLCRTVFTKTDAREGRSKVEAMANRLLEITERVATIRVAHDITCADRLAFDPFEDVDLIVAGTDTFRAQRYLNAEAVRRGIPAIFIGLHVRAAGGRVIWTIPGETGCYRCAAPERYKAADGGGDENDLVAAHGALVDGLLVDLVATKVALGILERGQDSVYGRFFESMRGRSDIVVRCDPSYEWGATLWNAVLGDLPSEPKPYAREISDLLCCSDTLWMKAPRDPKCPVCGDGT